MILSDSTIRNMIDSNQIQIQPFLEVHDIRPSGIRIHLGEEILIPKENQTIDLTTCMDIEYTKVVLDHNGYLLLPNMFILGSTYEKVRTPPNIVGHLEGRSTVARVGMAIHCTSGIIDSIHDEPRTIVLEIKNIGNFNLVLKPKMPIGMLLFSQLTSPVEQNSQSQYRNQDSVVAPNLYFQPKESSI